MFHKGTNNKIEIKLHPAIAQKNPVQPNSWVILPKGYPAQAAPIYAKNPANPVTVAAAFL